MNEEILKLIMSLDTSGVMGELSKIQKAMKDTIQSVSSAISAGTTPITQSLLAIGKYASTAGTSLANMTVTSEKGLEKVTTLLAQYVMLLGSAKGAKIDTTTGALSTAGVNRSGFEKNLENEFINIGVSLATSLENSLSGVSGRKAGKALGRTLSSAAIDEVSTLLTEFKTSTKDIGFWTEEYNQELLKAVPTLNTIIQKYSQMASSIETLSKTYAEIANYGDKAFRTPIKAAMNKEIAKVQTEFAKKTTGVVEGSAEWKAAIDALVVGLDKVSVKYKEILTIINKYKEQEDKLTAQRRFQAESLEVLKKKYSGIISLAGVLIDTNNIYYQKLFGISAIVKRISEQEQQINVYYDAEVRAKKEALALLTKQTRDPQIIAEATREILNAEKSRNKELEKTKVKAEQIAKILQGMQQGLVSSKEAYTAIKNLRKEMTIVTENTSFLGVSIKKLQSGMIRLGGATTGIIRTFSRWRNRLLVLAFAFGGIIRQMQKWISLSAETEKHTVALETVASNLGVATNSVVKAAQYLARDGILNIDQATQSMKNLLSTGASLDIVTKSLDTLKDAALANGRSMFTAGENIVSFTQGIKEGRSQITDNVGVMTNLSNITKKYADVIKEVGYANGILIGFTKEAMQFEGARVKILDTLSGRMMVLQNDVLMLKIAIGEAFKPISSKMVSVFSDMVAKVREYIGQHKELIESIAISATDYILNLANSIKSLMVPLTEFATALAAVSYWVLMISKAFIGSKVGRLLSQWLVLTILLTKAQDKIRKSIQSGLLFEVGKLITSLKVAKKEAFGFAAGMSATSVSTKKATSSMMIFGVVSKSALLPLFLIGAALEGILLVTKAIIDAKIREKEIDAMDIKKASTAKTIISDLSKQESILSNILSIEKKLPSNRTGIQSPSKAEFEANIARTKSYFGAEGAAVQESFARGYYGAKKAAESLQKSYDISDEIKALEEMGITYNMVTSEVVIMTSKNEKLFSMSLQNFKILNEALKEYQEKVGPIPQLQEDIMVEVQKLTSKTATYRQELEALSNTKYTGEVKKAIVDYKKESSEISIINSKLKEQETQLSKVIGNRKELESILKSLGVSEKDISEIASKGLMSAQDIMKEVKKYLGTTAAATEAAYKLMIGNIEKYLSNFRKELESDVLKSVDAIEQVRIENESLDEQIALLEEGAKYNSVSLKISKEESNIRKQIAKAQSDTSSTTKENSIEITNIQNALKDVTLNEVDRRNLEEEINVILRMNSALTSGQVELEKALNDQLEKRKTLLIQTQLNEATQKAEEILGETELTETGAVPLFFTWMFGSPSQRDSLFAEQKTKIDNVKNELLDTWSALDKEGKLTPELDKSIDEMLSKLEQVSPAMLKLKDIMKDVFSEILSMAKEFVFGYGDALREVSNEAYSSRVSLYEQRRLGIMEEEELYAQLAQVEQERINNEKVAKKQQTVTLLQSIRESLAAHAIEWTALAFAAAAMKDFSAAKNYIAAASVAGVGAVAINKALSSAEKELARAEGIASARSTAANAGTKTSNSSKASTYGSTVEGQPQYITISPSVAFYGDYLYLGDTVEEVGDKMSKVIVTEIKEAMEEGTITLSDLK